MLALHGIDVLSAQAHSDEQGMAASLFRFAEPAPRHRLGRRSPPTSERALSGELAICRRAWPNGPARTVGGDARRPPSALSPSVVFVDGASSNATVIEVRAPDSIGLLHRLTTALAEMGLDIRHATVQTIGPQRHRQLLRAHVAAARR